MEPYSQSFHVRWSDVDSNAHVRHSVYLDYCATLRMSWLKDHGYPMKKLLSLNLGPVLFRETVTYLKEVPPDAVVTAYFIMGALSKTGHKFKIEHHLKNEAGEMVATLLAEGAWFDTKLRKVVAPPEDLVNLMRSSGDVSEL